MILLVFLYSCQNSNQSNTNIHKDSLATVGPVNAGNIPSQQKSGNGYYTGIISCADCEAILQTLLLTPDHHFHLKEQYINDNSAPIITEGNWRNESGNIFLEVQGSPYGHYAFEDSILVMLDKNDKKITGKLVDNNHLKKSWIGRENKAWNRMKKDGVDFLIVGNEPFWSLTIDKTGKIIFTLADRADKPDTFSYAAPEIIKGNWVYQLSSNVSQIKILIRQDFCSDGMSDNWYEYSAEVTYNGETYKGCGVKMGEL